MDGLADLTKETETATSTNLRVPRPSATQTIMDLVEAAGAVRTQIGFLRADVDELHDDASRLQVDAFDVALERVTREQTRRGLLGLLEDLGSEGFSWRDVARLAGVSVAAVHKWRTGSRSTPEHRGRIAGLVALCSMLRKRFFIQDVASWLEMPLVQGVPVAGLDLLVANRIDLLLRWAAHAEASPETILDEFDSDWRRGYRSAYEVFMGSDGQPGIGFRES